MVRECLNKSPIVGVGQTFVTKFGNIRLIQLYDSGSGMIGIKPNGWSEVYVSTADWRVEEVGPMTVKTNFFTLAGGGCNFWVCGPDVPAVTPTPSPTPTPTPTPTTCRQEFRVYNGLIGDAPGATVTINGVVYTTNSIGYTSVLLTVGKEYTATGKFEDRSKTYTFTACSDIIKFRLVTIIIPDGFLYCKAYDSVTNAVLNATIVVDGVTQPNKTPGKTYNLPPGVHTVAFNLTGYLTKVITAEVRAAETIDVTVRMVQAYTPTPTPVPTPAPTPAPSTGSVRCQAYDSVTNSALNATIKINGNTVSQKTPYTIPNLTPANYRIDFIHSGYLTKTVTVTVKAGQTVNAYGSMVKITTPTPAPTPSPYTGSIRCQAYDSVTNSAIASRVFLDGALLDGYTPLTASNQSVGSHTIRFVKTGYIAKTVTVNVVSNQTVNAYGSMVKEATPTPVPTPTPTPTVGYIRCQAYDSVSNKALYATVRIDGQTIAPKSPCTTQGLSPGSHTVTFIHTGYITKTVTVSVIGGRTVYASGSLVKVTTPTPAPTPSPTPTPVPSQMGKIHCLTNPLGADVYIKDMSLAVPFYLRYGISNLYNVELKEGSYTVKYSKTGYQDFITTVYVPAGELKYVSGQLVRVATPTPTPSPTPSPNTGSMRIQAYDSVTNANINSRVFLNGGLLDESTPVTVSGLDVRSHSVKFVKSGYEEKTVYVNVIAGQRVDAYGSLVRLATPTPVPTPTPIPGKGYIRCQAYDSVTNKGLNTTLRIDGTTIAPKTPHTTPAISIGTHKVTFILEGYVTKDVTVTVRAGLTAYAYGSMVKVEDVVGFIKCQAYDSFTNAEIRATVQIDGLTLAEKSPVTTRGLPPGPHTVKFIYEGYTSKTVTATVIAGQTIKAYAVLDQIVVPEDTGFDVKVNILGLLPKSSLHIQQVIKVPFTDTWWNAPLGHGMRWDNIGNGVYKARGRSADSSPTPSFHTGFDENEDYAVYVGTSAIAFYPGSIIHRSTGTVIEIDLTSSYIDWVSSKVCAAMDITPANCPFFIASSVNDAAFFLELWSIITKHENLAGEHTLPTALPTALDYGLLPIAIFGMLSPGISEGKIVQVVGKRITELIPLSRKGTTEIKAVMQDPGIDSFLLRATETQFKDFVRYIDDGLHINAKNLLKTVDDAPLSANDLHALQRASKFVEELDPKLIKAGSIESLKTVLKNFGGKFKNIFRNALDFAKDNPKTSIGIGVLAIWFMVDNVPFYIYMYLKTKGRAPGDRSWQAKLYVDKIDQYKFNVINAEKIQDWDLFCSNLGLMEDAIDTLETYILANKSTLENEETYGIYEGTVQVYREAIKLKREVHTCAVTLPETINAEVMEILDSDTVRIRYNDSDYTVRLLGINAPEGKNYDYTCTGVRSPYLIRRLVTPGKECIEEETWTGTQEMYDASKVWIGQNLPVHQIAQFSSDSARQFDKYGRLLAVPFYNGKNVSMESLKAGQSVVFFYDYNKQVSSGAFLAAEQIAKDAKTGVWAVEAGVGSIRCVSNPTAAEVWLDGEYTGKKTISSVAYLYNIPVGEHTVEFKKIIDGVSHACSRSVTVVKGITALAECTLVSGVTPTPTPIPGVTPTPTPAPQKATWQIGDVKNEAGAILGAAKVYVDNTYVQWNAYSDYQEDWI